MCARRRLTSQGSPKSRWGVGSLPRHAGVMSGDQATNRLSAALDDVESESWARRAAAGRQLAEWAEHEEAGPVLQRLLLDAHDTGVTQATARALLERQDVVGLRTVLGALSQAASTGTADQLVGEVYMHQSWMVADDQADEFVRQLTRLTDDADAGIRDEAQQLLQPPERS